MDEQQSLGLLLRSVDYGDADRIVTFLTPDLGKVGMFARAARRSKRRFGGALEPFQRVRLRYRERGRGGLASLAGAEVVATRRHLMADYDRITLASYLTELVSESVHEREPLPDLFRLLDSAYGVVDDSVFSEQDPGRREGWLAAFELEVLVLSGYAPVLDGCTVCGVADERAWRFDVEAGGLRCSRHAQGGAALSADAATALRESLRTPVDAFGDLRFDAATAAESRRALGAFLRWQLGKELKSARFVDSGPDAS